MPNKSNRVFKIDKLPAVKRLPAYLHLLRELSRRGEEFVSSSYFSEKMQIQPILVRKDLELTRVNGAPRKGYEVIELIKGIENFLGWNKSIDAFLIGVGQLGSSILGNQHLMNVGLKVVAAFDKDPAKIGRPIEGVSVFELGRLPELAKRIHVRIAILCVPPEEAQKATDLLVAAGIKGIWNFTHVTLVTPEDVVTQKEDLASGLAVMSAALTQSIQHKNN